MQKRPYAEKDGWRIWLSGRESRDLLSVYADDPERQLALALGLHGLRVSEIVNVRPEHIRANHADHDQYILTVPDGKDGRRRELPLSPATERLARIHANSSGKHQTDPLVTHTPRSLTNWVDDARQVLDGAARDELGMHDLRRTWATRTYYALASAGVIVAEEMVMGWGGWKQNARGRETFRENYLGPIPDDATADATQHLDLPEPV